MEAIKALQMFNIEDIGEEDKNTLNKKYKQLAKKYHPDSYKQDNGEKFKEVTDAYNMLLDLLKQVQVFAVLNKTADKEKIIYITFPELIQIYQNKHKSLTKQDLYKNRILIIFTINTLYKTDIQTITSVNLWNIDDRYDINIELYDTDTTSQSCVDIKIGTEDRHIELNYTSTKYIMTLENNIKLYLTITKKLV